MSTAKSRRLTIGYLALVAMCAGFGLRPADATILVNTDWRRLTGAADLIALGRVEQTSARWEQGRIVTTARVRVEKTVKGAPPPALEVVVPGGKVDGVVMRVLGAPELRPDDRAILLLARRAGAYRVVGLAQGKLEVDRAGRVAWPGVGQMPVEAALERLRALVQ